MTVVPKSGFPFDPLRASGDKPASNLYTGAFGNSKVVSGSESQPSAIKNVDALVTEIQGLASADDFNVDTTVNFVAQGLLDFFEASGVAIAIEQGSRILCCASAGATAPEVGTELNVASGISGVCFRTGQSQYCHDARRDERVDFETCKDLGILSILIAPVLVNGRTVGLVEIFSPEEFFFDKNDISSLERIADLVGQAHVRKPAALSENRKTKPSQVVPEAVSESAILTPSFVEELLAAATMPKAAAAAAGATASPTIAYSPAMPANSVVSTPVSTSSAPARSTGTITRSATSVNLPTSKPATARNHKPLLLGVSILALLVAGGLGTRALLREKPDAQNSPAGTPVASAIPQPAAPVTTTPNSIARSTATGTPVGSAATANPTDKKPTATDAATAQSNSSPSRAPQVMDLLASNRNASAIPQRKPTTADITPEAPSLNSVSLNKSPLNLASTISTGAASVPKLNHTPVIEPEKLTYKVTPVYPAMARSAHVNGEVVVRLMIGKDGIVRNPVIERGPQMLRGAVLEAVKQWKYKPYKVDGDPREIEAVVSVKFQ